MTYAELKSGLLELFQGQHTLYRRVLEMARQGTKSLQEYNVDFSSKAAAVTSFMDAQYVCDLYVRGLADVTLRNHLSAFLDEPL